MPVGVAEMADPAALSATELAKMDEKRKNRGGRERRMRGMEGGGSEKEVEIRKEKG